MNKRIKKKVTKRVLNKIKNDNPLTKFEKRFLMKYLYPTFKETLIAVRNAIEEYIREQTEFIAKKFNELDVEVAEEEPLDSDAIDALRYSLEPKPTDEERFQNATDAINNFGKRINPVPSVTPLEEPNKWNKLKGTVKGWLGK